MLLCLNNGLLLFFCNSFLLFDGLCCSISGVELVHLGFKLSLLDCFYGLYLCGGSHSFLFVKDDRLLLGKAISCENSGIESRYFCDKGIIVGIATGNTLFLCFNNGLLLFFDDSLLLFRRLSSSEGSVELVHFGFELRLLGGLGNGLFGGRTNHSLLFGTDQCIFCLRGFGCIVGGIEGNDFVVNLFGIHALCIALLLCPDDSLLFSFNNSILFLFGFCILEFIVQSVHFGTELSLILGKNGGLFCCFEHRLLF